MPAVRTNRSGALTPAEAKRFYDRMGAKQDTQWFYEDPATRDLIAHAGFEHAKAVFELGCGTGRFAAELLETYLPAAATYAGCDLSTTMVELATQRLARFGTRARVWQSEGAFRFDLPDASVDRVVSNYVLDLLPPRDAKAFVAEARRILIPDGRLCLVSLTSGTTLLSGVVTGIWRSIYRIRPGLVGGCHPIELLDYVEESDWHIDYRTVVVAFGIPSEVVVAGPR